MKEAREAAEEEAEQRAKAPLWEGEGAWGDPLLGFRVLGLGFRKGRGVGRPLFFAFWGAFWGDLELDVGCLGVLSFLKKDLGLWVFEGSWVCRIAGLWCCWPQVRGYDLADLLKRPWLKYVEMLHPFSYLSRLRMYDTTSLCTDSLSRSVLLLLLSRCNTSGTLPWYSLAAVTCTSTLRVWLKTLGLKRTSLSASQTSGLSSVCVDF